MLEVLDRTAGEYSGWFAERSAALARVASWLRRGSPNTPLVVTPEVSPPSPPKVWYTTREAAEYLCMSRDALLKHVERGNVVPDNAQARGRVSGHRFRRDTLDSFITGLPAGDQAPG